MRLEPLPDADAAELVRQAAGSRLDEEHRAAIVGRAGGNPFFIVESTGMLLREGGAHDGEPLIPPTVQAMIAAPLDSLPSELRDLPRRLSVFRYDFDPDEVALVSDATEAQLEQLIDAEIIVRDETAGPHPSGGSVTTSSATSPMRASRSANASVCTSTIAERLEGAGALAWAADHLEAAAVAALDLDPADRRAADRAVDALLTAADRARRRMESRSALDLYRRALALAGPEDGWGVREARVFAGIGETRYWLAEFGGGHRGARPGDRGRHRTRRRLGRSHSRSDSEETSRSMWTPTLTWPRRSSHGPSRPPRRWPNVGHRAIALVPGVGAVDARPVRDVRRDLAPCSRDRARGR